MGCCKSKASNDTSRFCPSTSVSSEDLGVNSVFDESVANSPVSELSFPNLSRLNPSDLERKYKQLHPVVDQRFLGFNTVTPIDVMGGRLAREEVPSLDRALNKEQIRDGILHRSPVKSSELAHIDNLNCDYYKGESSNLCKVSQLQSAEQNVQPFKYSFEPSTSCDTYQCQSKLSEYSSANLPCKSVTRSPVEEPFQLTRTSSELVKNQELLLPSIVLDLGTSVTGPPFEVPVQHTKALPVIINNEFVEGNRQFSTSHEVLENQEPPLPSSMLDLATSVITSPLEEPVQHTRTLPVVIPNEFSERNEQLCTSHEVVEIQQFSSPTSMLDLEGGLSVPMCEEISDADQQLNGISKSHVCELLAVVSKSDSHSSLNSDNIVSSNCESGHQFDGICINSQSEEINPVVKEIFNTHEKPRKDLSVYSSSSGEPKELDLSALAPLCEVSNKEIVSMSKEICGIKKDSLDESKIVYLLVVFTFFDKLSSPMCFDEMCECVFVNFTKQMQSAVNRIVADTVQAKVRIIVVQFDKVFHRIGDEVSKQPDAESWLKISFLTALKTFLEDCVVEEKKLLSELCTVLEHVTGVKSIPWFGSLVPENMRNFIVKHVNTLCVANDVVFSAPKLHTPSFLSSKASVQKKVVSFFQNFLKSNAISYMELSSVLSRFEPNLLGELNERNPEALLAILKNDQSFKFQCGLVMLKGYTPVSPQKLAAVSGTNLNLLSNKRENKDLCSCCSGIVVTVGKPRATFWCSYSQTCKNVFVIAKRNKTLINGVLAGAFCDVLQEEDRVIFTTGTVSNEGWTCEEAVQVKVVSKHDAQSPCLCHHKLKMNIFHRPVYISNGIPFSKTLMFFWNTKGTIISMKDTKGIVKCMVNESSDQYFLVKFTNRTWVVGFGILSVNSFDGYLAVKDEVEVDISLVNDHDTGFLTWSCVCMRKISEKPIVQSILWNCVGHVVNENTDSISVKVISKEYKKVFSAEKLLSIPFKNFYLTPEGAIRMPLSQGMLKVGEKITFDLDMKNQYAAKFIRKCKRPEFGKSLPMLDKVQSNVKLLTVLQNEMSEDTPLFENVLENCGRDVLTFQECKDIQKISLESGVQTHLIDSLSVSSDVYCLNISNAVRDTSCQTTSTGPVLSALLPL